MPRMPAIWVAVASLSTTSVGSTATSLLGTDITSASPLRS